MRKKLMSIIGFICFLYAFISCIKDADDEPLNPPVPDPVPVESDSTEVVIDSLFATSEEYMFGEWMAQYSGYDPQMNKTSDVRRLVFFSPEGFYESHVQGIADIEDTVTIYKEFEHEFGTWVFDGKERTMTYTVEYDSLLNFELDVMTFFPGKFQQGFGVLQVYREKIWFSQEQDGRRDWIRTDDNLMSVDNHSARVVYAMKQVQ